MKRNLIIFSIALSIILSSCKNDPLDQVPSGRLELLEIFADATLTRSYLNSIYTQLPKYANSYYFVSTLSPKSDESADSDIPFIGGTTSSWNAGNLSTTFNPLIDYWTPSWRAIRRANVFLSHIDGVVTDETGNDPSKLNMRERDMLKGEAMLLRSFFLFELMKHYGPMPILDTELPASFDFSQLTRNSYDECAEYIAGQCDQAADLINVMRRSNMGEFGRLNSAFAMALKSRVLLYNASPLNNPDNDVEKWRKAVDAAKGVLSLVDEGTFALFPDYHQMFIRQDMGGRDADFKEMIYQLPVNHGPSFNHNNAIPFANGYKSGTLPSQELVDSYPMANGELPILGYSDDEHLKPIINPNAGYDANNPYENRDSRLYASVFYNGSVWGGSDAPRPHVVETYVGGSDQLVTEANFNRNFTRTGYYLKKFIDPWSNNGFADHGNDATLYWPVFRISEFYLNYAEALNEMEGPTSAVYNAINQLRERAGTGPVPPDLLKEQMREVIRNERRIELAFEEHRFYDVRRWKILNDTDRLVTGMKITKATSDEFEYERFVVETRAAYSDKFLTFPIDINELSRLPGVSQSSGW